MATKNIWAFDISRNSIKAVCLRPARVPEILQAETLDLPETSDDQELWQEAVQSGILSLIEKHRISTRDGIVMSVPGSDAFSRPVSLPPVDPKKLAEMVEFEAQQYIPFPIAEVQWDFHVLNPDAVSEGGEPQVLLFAMRKEVVQPYLNLIQQHHLDFRVLQTNPVATYNFVKFEIAPETPIVVLDIGAQTTSLIIINQNNFWIRNLPIAGEDITKRLQKKLKLSHEEAERLKLTMSDSKQAQKIFQVIEPTLKELVGEVHRSMGYYKSQAGGVKFTHLLLLGGGSNVYGLPRYFENQLQLKISKVKDFKHLSLSAEAAKTAFGGRLGGYATAVGLALQGMDAADSKVNFLPKTMLETRKAAEWRPFYLGAAALLAIAVLLLAFKAGKDAALLAPKVTDLQNQIMRINQVNGAFTGTVSPTAAELSLNQLLAVNADRGNEIDYLSKVLGLSTVNFDYPADESGAIPVPALTARNEYLVAPNETDKIYLYDVTLRRMTAAVGAKPGAAPAGGKAVTGAKKTVELGAIELYISGSLLHNPADGVSDVNDKVNARRLVQERLEAAFPKDAFPGRTNLVLDRVADAQNNTDVHHSHRWDPREFSAMSAAPDGAAVDAGAEYYFFTVSFSLPAYGDFFRVYMEFFLDSWKNDSNLAALPDEAAKLDACGRAAVDAIVKQYKTATFAAKGVRETTGRAKFDMTAEQALRWIEPRLGEDERARLRTALGLAAKPADMDR